jgi:hypothetical protein
MSQTESKPYTAMASHSSDGTEDKLTFLPYFWLKSVSHTHVLISYEVGYGGQTDEPAADPIVSTTVALMAIPPDANGPSQMSTTTRRFKNAPGTIHFGDHDCLWLSNDKLEWVVTCRY